MWSKRSSRILATTLGVFALIVSFEAGLWPSPTSESSGTRDMMWTGSASELDAGSVDSAAVLGDPLLPTAIQRRNEQIRTDRLAPTPESNHPAERVRSPEENQAQVPMFLRLVIVAGCLCVAIGSGWIIYTRSQEVVKSRRRDSALDRGESASHRARTDSNLVVERAALEPAVETSNVADPIGPQFSDDEPGAPVPIVSAPPIVVEPLVRPLIRPETKVVAVIPDSLTEGIKNLGEMIRTLNETVHAFDSRLANFVRPQPEERSRKERSTQPRVIEFASDEDLSPEALLPAASSTDQTIVEVNSADAADRNAGAENAGADTAATVEPDPEVPTASLEARSHSGAALSLIRSRRGSRASETGSGESEKVPIQPEPTSTNDVANVADLGAMRERVLELAGRGLPAADISRQVGLSATEVGLILRTLFDSERPERGTSAIRAAE